MKKWKHISFVLMICAFFISCKKNKEPEPVTFSGKVTDNIQGIAVSNASITIKLQQSASNNVFNSGFSTVATTTTDAAGNYSVTFTPDDPVIYKIVVEKQFYQGKEKEISASSVPGGSVTVTNFGIDPIGWFRINIFNVNPFDIDDNLIYQNTSEASGCSTCCNNTPVNLTGMNVDTFFICQRVSAPTITFSWFVTKNGNLSSFSNSVNAIMGDTVVYDLNY